MTKIKFNRVFFARVFFYTRLGWGSYIAWWLGAIAYVTIIYELLLVKIIPDTPVITGIILVGLLMASGILGYAMKELKIFGEEHAINAETNPYINKPIGFKEIANYEMRLQGLDVQIQTYDVHLQRLEMQQQEYEMRIQSIKIRMLELQAMMDLKINKDTKSQLMKTMGVLKEQIRTVEKFKTYIRDQIRINQEQREVSVGQRKIVSEILSRAPANRDGKAAHASRSSGNSSLKK